MLKDSSRMISHWIITVSSTCLYSRLHCWLLMLPRSLECSWVAILCSVHTHTHISSGSPTSIFCVIKHCCFIKLLCVHWRACCKLVFPWKQVPPLLITDFYDLQMVLLPLQHHERSILEFQPWNCSQTWSQLEISVWTNAENFLRRWNLTRPETQIS